MRDTFFDDRELPGIENLKALSASLEHEEEVQRHIEEGHLPPQEKAMYILGNGSTGQKISMLQHLDRTVKECEEKQIAQILSELNKVMWTQDVELQCAAPPALITILPMVTEPTLFIILNGAKGMLESRPEARKAWNELLVELVGFLSPESIVREIIPLSLKKTEHSEPHDQRLLSCQLMGKMCRRLTKETIVTTYLEKAMTLCQDTDTTVRVAMCEQLADISRAVGLELTKERITAELFELLVDEEKLVSRVAFTCLIDLVEFFDPPYRREHFYPIIKSYISSPPEEVLSLLIEEFGRFLWKIKTDIQGQEDVQLFANFFRQCSQRNDPDIRRMCAFNLPAVVASLPIAIYPTHISQITRALATDSHMPARRAVAAGLHELFTLLSDKAAYFLKDSFSSLIQDQAIEVRSLAVRHLSAILDVFSTQLKGEERDQFFTSIIPALVTYELGVRKDWRKVLSFFNSFTRFPAYFAPQTIHEKFLPMVLHHLSLGAAAIKEMCASLTIQFLQAILPNSLLGVDAIGKLTSDFGKGASCHNRLGYLLLFKHCIIAFSRKFLKDRMVELVLEMAKDPTPIVRAGVARVMPDIRKILRPPAEQDLVTHYQATLQRLQQDADEGVQSSLRAAQPRIDEIERDFARFTALKLSPAAIPEDLADKRKEEAEGQVLEALKEQEKLERRQKLREMLKGEKEFGSDFPGPAGKKPGKKVVVPTNTHRPVPAPVRPTVSAAKQTTVTKPLGLRRQGWGKKKNGMPLFD